MENITVVVFSYNNEKIIKDCLLSAKLLTDKIILIDQQSTDQTPALAKQYQATVYLSPHYHYVEPAREFGIRKAVTDWVFILDSDERITPQLAQEIKAAIRNPQFSYYRLCRKNIFIDQWLKHGGWWPDQQIRLINKKYFITWPKTIHSTPQIKGKEGLLKNPLLHLFHGDLKTMVDKTLIFEDIESDLLLKAHKPVSTLTFFRKFFGELWRRLVKNLGFLDGTAGIIESIYQAFSKTITYLFLYEKYQNKKTFPRQGRPL